MTRYFRTGSVAATADFVANMSPELRDQRAAHLLEWDRQQRLAAAQADVEAARQALQRVRDTSAEQAALDAALKRLADIKVEDQ
ncbi:hypothetical protein LRP30_02965 [Bradyrhizobium sp. C-145]|uniref:hypothetical protein n=1 Tax=Bradyrhizobium sp. C-145 TaxID=574727 RepID=UPI00201B7415|nr:hypothetical protein [Bradyrhizobium sp. C-145]UQR64297.1 hypothetical protein LRP30_02965 [Bradyrhizobium sp. C-145]